MTDDLQAQIEALEQRVEELEDRLDGDGDATPEGTLDRYDATVLDRLEEGQTYSFAALKTYYRQAGVRQKATIKRRIKHLTKTYCRTVGVQQWEFTGGDVESRSSADGG